MAMEAGIPVFSPMASISATLSVILRANSLTRDPPNIRWVWQSTNPGATIFPWASRTSVPVRSNRCSRSAREPVPMIRPSATAMAPFGILPRGLFAVETQVMSSAALSIKRSAFGFCIDLFLAVIENPLMSHLGNVRKSLAFRQNFSSEVFVFLRDERRTSNIERPTSNEKNCSMPSSVSFYLFQSKYLFLPFYPFKIRCWTFDVGRSFFPQH